MKVWKINSEKWLVGFYAWKDGICLFAKLSDPVLFALGCYSRQMFVIVVTTYLIGYCDEENLIRLIKFLP